MPEENPPPTLAVPPAFEPVPSVPPVLLDSPPALQAASKTNQDDRKQGAHRCMALANATRVPLRASRQTSVAVSTLRNFEVGLRAVLAVIGRAAYTAAPMKLRTRKHLVSLSLFAATLFGSHVAIAEPVAKWRSVAPTRVLTNAAQVKQFLVEDNDDAFELKGVHLEPSSVSLAQTYRFTQRYEGLRVWGTAVAARLDRQGRLVSLSSKVARDLSVFPVPAVLSDEAREIVREAHGSDFDGESSELIVVPNDEEGLLGWLIEFPDAKGGMSYIVDANTGGLLRAQPLALDVKGRVYGVSSVVTPTPTDVDLAELDVAAPQLLNGWSGLFRVTNYLSGDTQGTYELEQTVVPNVGPDFLYDPPASVFDATDAFAQVNLYHHMTDMRAFFNGLGVTQTSNQWKLTAVANAQENGQALDNAFYSPQLTVNPGFEAANYIVIGQGSINDFSYDSDVFKHEFAHYVSQVAVGSNLGNFNINSYGLSPHSGSIDEGIADYFACSDNDDPTLGEASLALLGGARELDQTGKSCPDDIVGEVHADGEIIGSFGWTLRTTYGQAIGDKLVWGALALLPPGGTFGDFAKGITATANELVTAGDLTAAQLTDIQGVMAARGLDICNEEIPLEGDDKRKLTMIGADLLAQFFGGSCSQVLDMGIALPGLFHFFRTTKADDKALVWNFEIGPQGAGEPEITVYVRKNTHVTFKPGLGGFLPEPDKFDAQFTVTSDNTSVVIDASTMPAFEPGKKYYVAFVNRSCPNVAMSVSATNEAPTPMTTSSTGGAGGEASGGSGGAGGEPQVIGGCDCSVPASSGDPRGVFLAAVAAFAVAVRRSRKRNQR
jgi:MYXO-CTERM domain-containing protein